MTAVWGGARMGYQRARNGGAPKRMYAPQYARPDAAPRRADALATAFVVVGFVWTWVWLFPAGFDK